MSVKDVNDLTMASKEKASSYIPRFLRHKKEAAPVRGLGVPCDGNSWYSNGNSWYGDGNSWYGKKWYDFLKSCTTFWWEQLIRTKFSREFSVYTANSWLGQANTRRYQSVFGVYIMFVRGGASLASTFQKNNLHLHQRGWKCRVQRLSAHHHPCLNLHLSFTEPSPAHDRRSSWAPPHMTGEG